MNMYAADSHPGMRRDHNEDSYKADPEHGLWVIADGVGGHSHGEVASTIATETVQQDLSKGSTLVDAIQHSHKAIIQEINSRTASNMGSTVVALSLKGVDYEVAWVGDSRAYIYNGDIKQISRDHNPVSEMLARGAITAEQAAIHPERNVLSQSLGVSENISVKPGRIRGHIRPGDQILLCSDGLTDELSDQSIAQIMTEQRSPKEQVDALIQGALDAGGRDNITVVVVGDKSDHKSAASSDGGTLNNERAVVEKKSKNKSHDGKVLLLMGAMALAAIAWVVLKVIR